MLLVPIAIMAVAAWVALSSESLEVGKPSKEVREIAGKLSAQEETEDIAGALLDAHKGSLEDFVANANAQRKSTIYSLLWILVLGH